MAHLHSIPRQIPGLDLADAYRGQATERKVTKTKTIRVPPPPDAAGKLAREERIKETVKIYAKTLGELEEGAEGLEGRDLHRPEHHPLHKVVSLNPPA